jgi:hypothetical protein
MEQIPSQTSLVITDGNYMLLFSLDITNIIFLVSNSIAIYNFLEITQCYSSGNFFPFFHVNSLLFYYTKNKKQLELPKIKSKPQKHQFCQNCALSSLV